MLALFYFFNVFIGMFLENKSYQEKNASAFYQTGLTRLTSKPYNIIEAVLLGLLTLEIALKYVFTSRQSKRV